MWKINGNLGRISGPINVCFFPLYFSSAIPGPRGAWLRVATSSPPRAHFWPASAGVGRGRARERCGAGDERDRWISPPEHARPRCVDGGPASVQRRFFVIIVFGGALIDHAASDIVSRPLPLHLWAGSTNPGHGCRARGIVGHVQTCCKTIVNHQ